jgi:hypothetical protein
MVDPTRGVAVASGIDHKLPVHDEQHRMLSVLGSDDGVAAIGRRVRNALAFVLHDALALSYLTQGEHAFSVNRRAAHGETRSPVPLAAMPLFRCHVGSQSAW